MRCRPVSLNFHNLIVILQNAVGPGRYDVQKFGDAQDINGHQSDFKSKTNRPDGERLKFLQ